MIGVVLASGDFIRQPRLSAPARARCTDALLEDKEIVISRHAGACIRYTAKKRSKLVIFRKSREHMAIVEEF